MRLSTTIVPPSPSENPDREHDNDKGGELQHHPPAHQLLGCLWRATACEVEKSQEQHCRDREQRDRNQHVNEDISHPRPIAPGPARGHGLWRKEKPATPELQRL